MVNNAYASYLETKILSADPVELIEILYSGALESVERARAALQAGDISTRSKEISKTSEIINELALSLNHEQGGEISRNLAELYDYMQRRLIEANVQQIEAPLIEVGNLLATLREGWTACRKERQAESMSENTTPPYYGEVEHYSSVSFTG